ncbi:MAG: helix-turn-helix domain-containing protein [Acidimicrobiales bacterium]
MDVELVAWPAESDRSTALAAQGAPRLLLVTTGSPPPPPTADCLQDWVRVPADGEEVALRVLGLQHRAQHHALREPLIDDDGVLRYGTAWVALPPIEASLARVLTDRFGGVVGRDLLMRAAWAVGARPTRRNVLDVHMLRLRRRLDGIQLAVRTIPGRGYLLEQKASRNEADQYS